MKLKDLRQSNYLKQTDFSRTGNIVTVKAIRPEVVGQGADEEEKFVVYFKELEKGLILNVTNGQVLADISGSEEGDDWIGAVCVIYSDPSIRFGGQKVGGLRLRPLRDDERAQDQDRGEAHAQKSKTAGAIRSRASTIAQSEGNDDDAQDDNGEPDDQAKPGVHSSHETEEDDDGGDLGPVNKQRERDAAIRKILAKYPVTGSVAGNTQVEDDPEEMPEEAKDLAPPAQEDPDPTGDTPPAVLHKGGSRAKATAQRLATLSKTRS
jgi:hypothetical protein